MRHLVFLPAWQAAPAKNEAAEAFSKPRRAVPAGQRLTAMRPLVFSPVRY
jgi:hypothetical protein